MKRLRGSPHDAATSSRSLRFRFRPFRDRMTDRGMSGLLLDEAEVTRVSTLAELKQEIEAGSQRDRAYLIVLAGTNVGEMFRIDAGESFVGRGQVASIRLND